MCRLLRQQPIMHIWVGLSSLLLVKYRIKTARDTKTPPPTLKASMHGGCPILRPILALLLVSDLVLLCWTLTHQKGTTVSRNCKRLTLLYQTPREAEPHTEASTIFFSIQTTAIAIKTRSDSMDMKALIFGQHAGMRCYRHQNSMAD